MKFSKFGERISQKSGIMQLMDDLGRAMAGRSDMYMLGGGNPAHIPEMQAAWKKRIQTLINDEGSLGWMLANYDTPQGHPGFIEEVAAFLKRNFGWAIGPENIAVTTGAQYAFFGVLNMLAGTMPDGSKRRILLPLMPEYVGYANQGLEPDFFRSIRPAIEFKADHVFKYRVDFEHLRVTEDIGAICASRPTNPTGNVLTDEEIRKLDDLARKHGVPLILDCAYGLPFPGIVFSDVQPFWNENTIITMSLSKLGLPGTRTAVVVGPPVIASAVASMTSILSLSNGNLGQAITMPMFKNDEILRLSRDVIRPFYTEKRRQALEWVSEFFNPGLDYHMHASEGAFFLWFWFRDIPVRSEALYERLKQRGVLVVSGENFFFGMKEDWPHRHECIRVNYSGSEETVREGLRIIADEVGKAFAERR